ncbi:hypothetical protein W97_05518 [Coniosporium apollinis CBS 100218]|uniref:HhH-GPD domain-containing protein n=1 Tax=Coniosporium apollinis (strain CBS 100218) TaxID=1168221 RepID=R7YXL6_CONA1|nr:uncharacterized protein W97_05518 [Coniosporium apollinis CBS 100218]EON66421.1 hypothetical protein W97_05518 [Coniosporium apollinis CBS 100218]
MARTTRSSAAKAGAAAGTSEVQDEPQQLSSPPPSPALAEKQAPKRRTPARKTARTDKKDHVKKEPATPNTSRKRTRTAAKEEEEADEDNDELPHNLGKAATAQESKVKQEAEPTPKKRKTRNATKKAELSSALEEAKPLVTKLAQLSGKNDIGDPTASAAPEETPKKRTSSAKKEKSNNYGLKKGETPYPDWPHPTPAECQEVVDALSKVHGKVTAPKEIPIPSLTVSGCGEVPSVLDALIRTRLSAATNGANSSRAFKGLVERFGVLQSGVGKGSVDWDAVRRADLADVFEAIKSGGLADVKSKDIKKILDMVYAENQARRKALTTSSSAMPAGAENSSKEATDAEIARADEGVLSLDHLHQMESEDAFQHLIKYPGIGPKTASCVLLFCLQRPSFAVDTHVFRLCKWLGWVPPDKATRNTTYAHCEVRVPDELKYPLHQLLIKHGKSCPRCRAITGESSEGWGKGCPIEHLVKRVGGRKGGSGGPSPAKRKGKAKKRGRQEESEEESELSDLGTEEESVVEEEVEEMED